MAAKELYIKKLTQGRDHLLRLALLVSVLVPVWFVVAALGTKFGIWPWQVGLGQMTFTWGPALVLSAIPLALFALYGVLVTRPWGGRIMAVVAVVIPVLALLGIGGVRNTVAALPPIHDVSTNPASPPQFTQAILSQRAPDMNPIVPPAETKIPQSERFSAWSGMTVAAAQQKGYPDLKPLTVPAAPDAAYAAAEKALTGAGLRIVAKDPATRTIEATAETFWFGFKDDVVVVVSAEGTGSRIDVRSVSRVGLSDLGANAKRIQDILSRVQA